MTCSLLRAVGPTGQVISYEVRDDHAEHARRNVATFFGETPPPGGWSSATSPAPTCPTDPSTGSCSTCSPVGRVGGGGAAAGPGRVLIVYVATVTQLSRVVEALREQQCWTEPRSWETLQRDWDVVGLAVRPNTTCAGTPRFWSRYAAWRPG